MHLINQIEKIDNFLFKGFFLGVDTYSFWYIKNKIVIKSAQDFDLYKDSARPSPIYFIDYGNTYGYKRKNDQNIIILNYSRPIGQQVNPEAAFQYALGLHDLYKRTKNTFFINEFLRYAKYFLNKQNKNTGSWEYTFEYGKHPNPWHSALAQARGASVLLRAGLLLNDMDYLNAAESALSLFSINTDNGGFRHRFLDTDHFYYEEYPYEPTGVINGFMVALIGLWEHAFWTQNTNTKKLYDHGIETLKIMLPMYTTPWWTRYDLSNAGRNLNSPFYHNLIISYLTILDVLSPNDIFKKHLILWKRFKNPLNLIRAVSVKTVRKLLIG